MESTNGPGRERVLGRVRGLVDEGKFDEALKVIAASGVTDPAAMNAAGVCHLRAGRPERAVSVYRDLCVGDGLGIRRDARSLHVANYATALLLANNFSGYRHALRTLRESAQPDAPRLHDAITAWERGLGRWRRVGMMLGLCNPKQPIDLGFLPGEF